MAQYIEVGDDVIEFPDDMSDEQIAKVLSGQGSSNAPQPSGFRMGLVDPLAGVAQIVDKALPQGVREKVIAQSGGRVPQGGLQQQITEAEQAYQQQRKASGEEGMDWDRLGGNLLNPLNYSIVAGAGAIPAVSNVAKSVVAGAASSATAPVVDGENFNEQKLTQIGTGAALAPLGEIGASATGRLFNPLMSRAEQTMRELGIRLTPGQALGGKFKSLEEFAQNLPLVGSLIRDARQRAVFDFNKAVINKTLKKVDEALPEDVVGRDAVQYTAALVGKKYDEVLGQMTLTLKPNNLIDFDKAISKANLPDPKQTKLVKDITKKFVLDRLPVNTPIEGPAYKAVESDLRKTVSGYLSSGTAYDRQIGEALEDVLVTLKDQLRTQNPKYSPQLRRVDSAFRDLDVMQTAAANSGARNGVFTPKNYQTAVRVSDKSNKKRAYARGNASGQELAEQALEILGENTESTLEGRLTMATGGMIGAASNPIPAAVIGTGLAGIYSKTGNKLVDALIARRPSFAKEIGKLIQNNPGGIGGLTEAQILEAYNKSERN